ncbi:hypothetical protein Q5752_001755 [Cryptotrichosporon argae]
MSYRTLDFLAPSLHPNTLLSLSVPEPSATAPREPVVKSLPIKYGEHQALGVGKRIIADTDGSVVVADDAYRISRLRLPENSVPEVITQHSVTPKAKSTWTGLASSAAGPLAALSTGHLTLFSNSPLTTRLPGPLLTLSALPTWSSFAVAGKEVDISLWDAGRVFSAAPADDGKRKKDALQHGEIWRGKNVPNNHLSLRQPIYHLCSTFLGPDTTHIATGTKSGCVRRYDTRQRKPVSDWKVAREGGVGAITAGTAEHELFFADHSALLASLDLRTGRVLYNVPALTSTAHTLLPLPSPTPAFSPLLGLASVSSDATLRVHQTLAPPTEAGRGNGSWTATGKKGTAVGMVGGVGGGAVFVAFGEGRDEVPDKATGAVGEDDEDEGEGDVWEVMDEVADEGSEDEDGVDSDDGEADEGESASEDDAPAPAPKRRRR